MKNSWIFIENYIVNTWIIIKNQCWHKWRIIAQKSCNKHLFRFVSFENIIYGIILLVQFWNRLTTKTRNLNIILQCLYLSNAVILEKIVWMKKAILQCWCTDHETAQMHCIWHPSKQWNETCFFCRHFDVTIGDFSLLKK